MAPSGLHQEPRKQGRHLYVVVTSQIGQFVRWAYGVRRSSLGEKSTALLLHRAGVGHPACQLSLRTDTGELSPALASVEDNHLILAEKEAGMKVVAGIDVGKQDLVVSVADAPVQRFANHETGITRCSVGFALGPSRTSCARPRGAMSAKWSACAKARSVHVAHPNRVRSAHVLGGRQDGPVGRAGLGALRRDVRVAESVAGDGATLELREAMSRRQQLVAQRVQEVNRLEKGLRGSVKKSCERHVAWLDKEIARLDTACREIVQRHDALRARAALYESVQRGGCGDGGGVAG